MVMVPRLISTTSSTVFNVSIASIPPLSVKLMPAIAQQLSVVSVTRPLVVRIVEVISNTTSSSLTPKTISFVLTTVVPDSPVINISSSSSGTNAGSSSSEQDDMANSNMLQNHNPINFFIKNQLFWSDTHVYLSHGKTVLTGANTSMASVSPIATKP